MATQIHPTAVVEPGAELDHDVVVGPFCYVGPEVKIGAGSELLLHASVLGPTTLGRDNRVFPHATLGAEPQDRSYRGEPTLLSIGDGNVFREQVSVHRGTVKGGGCTRIADRCLLMVGAHVATAMKVGGAGRTELGALARVPAYLLWKAKVLPKVLQAASREQEWVRTARDAEASAT